MKTRLPLRRLLLICCSAFTPASGFGQTTYTWTGAADGTNFATAGNWDPVGLANGTTQDTAQWDGRTTTNLVISCGSIGLPGTGYGTL